MNNLNLLIPRKEPVPDVAPRWATVTATAPMTVRFDGESLSVPAVSVEGNLSVADRVWTILSNSQVVVVGKYGGTSIDLSAYATTSALTAGLATKQATGSYAAASHTHTSANITDLATTLSPYATTSALTAGLATKQATGSYATTTDIVASKGRMIKTTAGPTVAAAGTFYQVTGFSSIPYNTGTMMATTGIVTIPVTGVYHIEFFLPWSSYGTAYARQLAIAKGTTAASIVASKNVQTLGVWQETVTYEDTCTAGTQFTFWIQSGVTGSGAVASTALIPPTSVTVKEVL